MYLSMLMFNLTLSFEDIFCKTLLLQQIPKASNFTEVVWCGLEGRCRMRSVATDLAACCADRNKQGAGEIEASHADLVSFRI